MPPTTLNSEEPLCPTIAIANNLRLEPQSHLCASCFHLALTQRMHAHHPCRRQQAKRRNTNTQINRHFQRVSNEAETPHTSHH